MSEIYPLIASDNSEEGSTLACPIDFGGHCVTCSDEALPATILRLDPASESALVLVGGLEREVDISLLGIVTAGDTVLVHGGVALVKQVPISPAKGGS